MMVSNIHTYPLFRKSMSDMLSQLDTVYDAEDLTDKLKAIKMFDILQVKDMIT